MQRLAATARGEAVAVCPANDSARAETETELKRLGANTFERDGQLCAGPKAAPIYDPVVPPPPDPATEIEALKARIAALEAKLVVK
jgi:hypothetical protein